MFKFKVVGIYSFADNLKKVKVNDEVVLKNEKLNIKSENAIGVYTIDDKKLGYLPVESKKEITFFNNSYRIHKLVLNQEFPLLEIARYYLPLGYIDNIEYPYIKKIKYETQSIIPSDLTREAIFGFENYLKTKKIKKTKIIVTFEDENYINIVLKTTKENNSYYTVTNNYFKNVIDKYEELYEYELIDNIFFKEFIFHRLECYFELNYKQVENTNFYFNYNKIIDKINIHPSCSNINTLMTILYLRYIIDNDEQYIIKKYKSIDINILDIVKNIFNIYTTLTFGKFYYNHNLQIYEYINFITEDYLLEIVDETYNKKLNNIMIKAYLCNKKNICMYNPQTGNIYTMNNINYDFVDNLLL